MSKRYFVEEELSALAQAGLVMDPAAYSLHAPVPQTFVVTLDPAHPDGPAHIRTATLGPLSWNPYTMSLNIPLDDTVTVAHLRQPGTQCVMALPTREQLRAITICSLRLPPGIPVAQVARLRLCRSLFVDPPTIADCPVNFECVVEHAEPYHTHLIVFVRVVGASIDDQVLFWERAQIVALYPTNDADAIVDAQGNRRQRVSLMGDLPLCPTFPVGPKQGWYGTFAIWMRDLLDEGYLRSDEYETVLGWEERWQQVFSDLASPERDGLRQRLTQVARLCARQRWAELHDYLAAE
jgi:flavin reductase (DIM6/NTAB) family NADH-FMN oxidoreductase RutF